MKRKTQDPLITQKVIEMIAAHYNTSPEMLKDKDGDRNARQMAVYTLKEEFGAPLRAIGEALNIKSSPTIYAAIKAVRAALKTNAALAQLVTEIKTEILVLAAAPEGHIPTPIQKPQPTSTSDKPHQPEQIAIAPVANLVIGKVQKAVSDVFLGADLLQSRDPAAEVMFAKDAVVFVVWDDFPKITKAELLNTFHLNEDGLYRAIGRVSVCLREDGSELKKKFRAVRAAYSAGSILASPATSI